MSTIYVVIHEDRHTDVQVQPYRDRDEAIAAARAILDDYDGQEEELLTGMGDDGWILFGTYSTEDDCVRVVERELR